MAKKKKPSLLWRATKASFRGIGRAFAFLGKSAYKGIKNQKLKQNPTYKKQPEVEQFKIIDTVAGDYGPVEQKLLNDSIIALIFGKRGSGKSALGFRILENIHGKTKRNCYVLGIGQTVMPHWIKTIENIKDVSNGSIILVDEGAIAFGSRESMSSKNRALSQILAIARHKNLTVLFITQNTGMIDKNILKLADMLLIKEGSLLQLEMERAEIKKFYEKAKKSFSNLEGERRQYAYLLDSDFEGVISHSLPSFWSTSLSKNRAK